MADTVGREGGAWGALPTVALAATMALTAAGCGGVQEPAGGPAAGAGEPAAAGPGQGASETVGQVTVTPIYHGSILLEWEGRAIHVDPWSRGDYRGRPVADLLLITDVHGDHLDPNAAARVMDEDTVVVAPAAVAARWDQVDVVLANGESTEVEGIRVEAVPMYNLTRGPTPGVLYHDKGRGNGYVLTLGEQRVYISGDTECVPEMRELTGIDIAFICMNLPYTMTPEEAAECVRAFRPAAVYPYHHRGSDLEAFEAALAGEPDIEVRILDWYPPSPGS